MVPKMVRILLFAQLHDAAAEKEVIINLTDPQTLKAIIKKLLTLKPKLKSLLLTNNQFSTNYQLLIDTKFRDYESPKLIENSAEIAILPPIGGRIPIMIG